MLGDRHKFIAAVIVPNFDRLREHVKSSNWSVDWTKLDSDPVIRGLYQQEIETYNAGKPHHEQIHAFAILSSDLTIEDGSITPTLKVKRRILESRYKDLIDSMYRAAEKAHVA